MTPLLATATSLVPSAEEATEVHAVLPGQLPVTCDQETPELDDA